MILPCGEYREKSSVQIISFILMIRIIFNIVIEVNEHFQQYTDNANNR